MKKKYAAVLAVAIVFAMLVVIIEAPYLERLSSIGYVTGTQGLQAQFDSVTFRGSWYSATEHPAGSNPSSMNFGHSMAFNPDALGSGYPSLCASQQPITVDMDIQPTIYSWQYKVASGVKLDNGSIADEYKQFQMSRYQCTWAINIWSSGSEQEAGNFGVQSPGTIRFGPDFGGSVIWVKLVPQSSVYFQQNPDQVFFAPAYVGVDQAAVMGSYSINSPGQGATTQSGGTPISDSDASSMVDLIPKAIGEIVGIYYVRGGSAVQMNQTGLLSYQGANLDPNIFRNEYWMRINLLTFKSMNWWVLSNPWTISHGWKFPSVYLHFMVYVFVIGTWTVYIKTGEVPGLQSHPAPSYTPNDPLANIISGLSGLFTNPLDLLIIILVLIILFVTIANPGVWAALLTKKKK